ncbi:sugar kinase [Curtobacterium sp. 'Ferrero']|uniref:ROK family transcriptional regulator n=1 Tax=Curtobacterium sp. 'Ferrero' TaxID=2033654 RepID=UPI000BDB0329|nr:ROK family transcriptional regulator [Curtobacterium sp. 'Ferrero']PCN48154.1 sugar kinase [Curtobacterium sp. 'Ferrero']
MTPPPRTSSRGLLLDLVRSAGPITRVELAERTGLTQATVSTTVRALINEGLVVETGRSESTGGKPRTWLEINPASRLGIGVHLGEGSVSYVVANLGGELVGRLRTQGIAQQEPAEATHRIARELIGLLDDLDVPRSAVVGIGIAAPGPIDRTLGSIGPSPHLPGWDGFGVRDAMEAATGIPCELENDATAAALSEYWLGATDDHRSYATVYMDAGIGAGIVVDGTVYRGVSSNVGEIGHVTVDPGAGLCRCGNVGCLELVAAPAAVVAAVGGRSGDPTRAMGSIARAAVAGPGPARAAIERSAQAIGSAVVTLVNLFDVDLVVLAGAGFTDAAVDYVREIERALQTRALARRVHPTAVRVSVNGQDAAVIGAATAVLQERLSPRRLTMVALSGT